MFVYFIAVIVGWNNVIVHNEFLSNFYFTSSFFPNFFNQQIALQSFQTDNFFIELLH